MKTTTSIFILILIFFSKIGFSQTVVQSVKGLVFDNETQAPLIGAAIVITGRYNIQISYIGYDPAIVSEILVTSGKEVVINTGLEQSVNQINEVTVKAYTRKVSLTIGL